MHFSNMWGTGRSDEDSDTSSSQEVPGRPSRRRAPRCRGEGAGPPRRSYVLLPRRCLYVAAALAAAPWIVLAALLAARGRAPGPPAPPRDGAGPVPSARPTRAPSARPTPHGRPPPPPPEGAGPPPSATTHRVYDILDAARARIDREILLYEGNKPSSVYRYAGFRAGLEVMVADGVAGRHFYLGEEGDGGHTYGLVNIAAFLGQSMKETIQYDACDENNWDFYDEEEVIYPLSNACGQLGQDYQVRMRSFH